MNRFSILFCLLLVSFLSKAQQSINLPHPNTHKCGTMDLHNHKLENDSVYKQNYENLNSRINELARQKSILRSSNQTITIPVVFHVMHNGEEIGIGRNIADEYLHAQIDQLNLDFRAKNTNIGTVPDEFKGRIADLNIEFTIAKRTPTNEPTTGINRYKTPLEEFTTSGFDAIVKTSTFWDTDQYLNIWVADISDGLAGYAQFPGGNKSTDGIVLNSYVVGSVNNPYPEPLFEGYGVGRTATHEIGHWLSLRHIWGDGISDAGCLFDDEVEDTPSQKGPNNGVPTHPTQSCGTNDMFMNYMDYTNGNIQSMFSKGQKERTDVLISTYRSSLINSPGKKEFEKLSISYNGKKYNEVCKGSIQTIEVDLKFYNDYCKKTKFSLSGLSEDVYTFDKTLLATPGKVIVNIDTDKLEAGEHKFVINGKTSDHEESLELVTTVTPAIESVPLLTYPINNTKDLDQFTGVTWSALNNVDFYTFELASDQEFQNVVYTTTTTTNAIVVNALLDANTDYYWRVKAQNICGGVISEVSTFQVKEVANCNNYIIDGDFEDGNGWTQYSIDELIQEGKGIDGSKAAVLSGNGGLTAVYQFVNLPANASKISLKYNVKIESEEDCENPDTASIVILDIDELPLGTIGDIPLCKETSTDDFNELVFDMTFLKGLQLGIGFLVSNDDSNPSTLIVDDVEFIICKEDPDPAQLTSFTAEVENNSVVLNWDTQSEFNNSHFEIERSYDGQLFESIGRLNGHGTTTVKSSYSFEDYTSTAAKIYYRLMQVAIEGDEFSYSEIKGIQFENPNDIVVYPNPVNANSDIKVATSEGIKKVSIYNNLGLLIKTFSYDGQLSASVDIKDLKTGVYILMVNDSKPQRLVIK